MLENNPYDQVPYVSYPFAQTHPNRLAVLAQLHGLQPAPITRCRVLEIGCGDGSNLIPMAMGLPESQFVGIDLATQPVERGQSAIAEFGLANIELRQADLLEFADEPFDYIIAHGVYAWVPPTVQDGLMALCQRLLKPQGIAYISYNAYPGCHLREMTREMMLFHLRGYDEPQYRIKQGLSLLSFLLNQYENEEKARKDLYGTILTDQFALLSRQTHREIVYHDYLSPHYRPAYFFQFAAHAEQHGLQYLSEADFSDMQDFQFPQAIRETLAQFDADHIVQREQYLDFLKCRSFRQTLLCHADLKINRAIRAEQITAFYLNAKIDSVSEPFDLNDKVVITFTGPHNANLQTDFPLAKAALMVLKEAWPRLFSWEELELAAVERLSSELKESVTAEDIAVLREMMLAAYCTGIVELFSHCPTMQLEVTSHPVASPIARWQSQRGKVVTNLLHKGVILDDELSRQLIPLMDGSHDHAALRLALTAAVTPCLPLNKPDGTEINEPGVLADWIAETLEDNLRKTAQLALLTK